MYDTHSILVNRIKLKIDLSDKELDFLQAAFHPLSKKKNDYLMKEGTSKVNLYFIVEGYVRSYTVDKDGNEKTTQIFAANDFVTSFESFLNAEATSENVQCTSDCSLLMISKEDYDSLYKDILHWSVFCKSVYENLLIRMGERVHLLQHLSATERYLHVLNQNPNIALHTAVKHLASYLGIKPQSLSRIRKEIK